MCVSRFLAFGFCDASAPTPELSALAASHGHATAPLSATPCPPELCELAMETLRAFQDTVSPDAFEAAWAKARVVKDAGDGIVIRALPRADSRSLTFRIDTTFDGVSARE